MTHYKPHETFNINVHSVNPKNGIVTIPGCFLFTSLKISETGNKTKLPHRVVVWLICKIVTIISRLKGGPHSTPQHDTNYLLD